MSQSYRRQVVRTPTGDLHALETGNPRAPLVVVLHGFPDDPRNFGPLADRLAAAGRRVLLPWLRGYHPSSTRGPFHPTQLAADLSAWIDALAPDRVADVVGHDWGAVCTYYALALEPARVRRAVAMSVPHPSAVARAAWRDSAQRRRSAYMAFFQLGRVADLVVEARDFAFIERLWRIWSPGWLPDPRVLDTVKETLSRSMPAPVDYYRAWVRPAGGALRRWVDFERHARAIRVPTLYLVGANDGCIAADFASDDRRYFAGPFRREIVPGAGHFLHVEQPDEVARRVIAWLRESPSEA